MACVGTCQFKLFHRALAVPFPLFGFKSLTEKDFYLLFEASVKVSHKFRDGISASFLLKLVSIPSNVSTPCVECDEGSGRCTISESS